jgi:hypothetical protein
MNIAEESPEKPDVDMEKPVEEKEDAEDDEDDEESNGELIKVLDPLQLQPALDPSKFENISNIRALRLLNDVDIRPAPPPPAGTKRVSPGHRLKDLQQWQEIYRGPTVWIYDARSNTDRSVRLVWQQNNVFGAATQVFIFIFIRSTLLAHSCLLY